MYQHVYTCINMCIIDYEEDHHSYLVLYGIYCLKY